MVDRNTTNVISSKELLQPTDDLEIQSIVGSLDSQSSIDDQQPPADDEEALPNVVPNNENPIVIENQTASNSHINAIDEVKHDQAMREEISDKSTTDDDDDDDDADELTSDDSESIEETINKQEVLDASHVDGVVTKQTVNNDGQNSPTIREKADELLHDDAAQQIEETTKNPPQQPNASSMNANIEDVTTDGGKLSKIESTGARIDSGIDKNTIQSSIHHDIRATSVVDEKRQSSNTIDNDQDEEAVPITGVRLSMVTTDNEIDVKSLDNDNNENELDISTDERIVETLPSRILPTPTPSMKKDSSNVLASDHENVDTVPMDNGSEVNSIADDEEGQKMSDDIRPAPTTTRTVDSATPSIKKDHSDVPVPANQLISQPDNENENTLSMDDDSEVSSLEDVSIDNDNVMDTSDENTSSVADSDDEANTTAAPDRNEKVSTISQTPKLPTNVENTLADNQHVIPNTFPTQNTASADTVPAKPIGSASLTNSNENERNSVAHNRQTPYRSMPNKEKSTVSIVNANDSIFALGELSDDLSIDDDQIHEDLDLDEHDQSIADHPSALPEIPANITATKVNMSCDEEKLSLLGSTDLTLRDVMLNDSRSIRQSIATSRKLSFAPSANPNMSLSDDFLTPGNQTQTNTNISSDGALTRKNEGIANAKVPGNGLPMRINDLTQSSLKIPSTFPKEQLSTPIESSDLIDTLPVNFEITQDLTVDEETSNKLFSNINEKKKTTNSPKRLSVAEGLMFQPVGTGSSVSPKLKSLSPSASKSPLKMLHPDERQQSNVSSSSTIPRSISSRRNTEHTIVDLRKVANIASGPQKPEIVITAVENNVSSTKTTGIHHEQIQNSTKSSTNVRNSPSFIRSTTADEHSSFLQRRTESESIDESYDLTNDESMDKIDIESETIKPTRNYMRKSSVQTVARKTPRLSFIDNAHVIQISSSKESHMRALPAEKFWRRNQRRVSSVPNAEQGQM